MYDKANMLAQGKNYYYLGMDLNLYIPWEVRVTMVNFTSQVICGFPRGDNEDIP